MILAGGLFGFFFKIFLIGIFYNYYSYYYRDCDEETKGIIWKKRKEVKKLHAETFSLRMDMLYRLSICNHVRDNNACTCTCVYTFPSSPSLLPSLPPSFPPSLLLSLPPSFSPSLPPSLPPSLLLSLPPSFSPSLPPSLLSLPPSLPPSFSPSLPPSLPPSFPPLLPSFPPLPPSFPPSLLLSLPPSFSPSLPPSLPLSLSQYRNSLFWLPHNMDFRSRVYPIPPHLTHLSNFSCLHSLILHTLILHTLILHTLILHTLILHTLIFHTLILVYFPVASDLGRSLIQFGIGHSLGKRGLEWLKIHIATLHGAKSK